MPNQNTPHQPSAAHQPQSANPWGKPEAQEISKEFKALLLNALVCPGAGHLYLGKRALGWLLMIISLLSLALMLSDTFSLAGEIAREVAAGSLPADPDALLEQVQLRSEELLWAQIAAYVFGGVWLLAILDNLRLMFARRLA